MSTTCGPSAQNRLPSAGRDRPPVKVAVIGAGLGGVAVAVNLARSGIHSFTVFERAAGPGGVWWQNTYPGCEVDIDSLCYSYSFLPYDWARTHATQPELQGYVEYVIDHYGLRGHFRFGTGVKAIRSQDSTGGWVVSTELGDEHFDVAVSCVGLFSEPNIPAWPGLSTFRGSLFHTSQYDHDCDLTGRRVAVVGTGSTACQLVPAIAGQAGRLDLYQREPGWILPKRNRLFTPQERSRYARRPWRRRLDRYRLFRDMARQDRGFDIRHPRHELVRGVAERHIAKSITDPDLRSAVTPAYAYGCKRPVLTNDFYPALNRDNVHLVPHAVTSLTEAGIVDDTGTERPADVIILATGFQTTNFLASLPVHGPDGVTLHERWADEPAAFLGITVPGFPNFFMLYGPNTNGAGSLIHQLERQAEVVTRAVRRLRPGQVLDTRPRVAHLVDRQIQHRIRSRLTALAAGCHNYYHSATGRNVTQWPGSAMSYWLATRLLHRFGLRKVKR